MSQPQRDARPDPEHVPEHVSEHVPEQGRGVLVTGASRGVGAALARCFAERGDRVVVHFHSSRDRAEEVLAGLPGEGHVALGADLADPAAVRRLAAAAADHLGRVDVLVNNAALFLDPARAGGAAGAGTTGSPTSTTTPGCGRGRPRWPPT